MWWCRSWWCDYDLNVLTWQRGCTDVIVDVVGDWWRGLVMMKIMVRDCNCVIDRDDGMISTADVDFLRLFCPFGIVSFARAWFFLSYVSARQLQYYPTRFSSHSQIVVRSCNPKCCTLKGFRLLSSYQRPYCYCVTLCTASPNLRRKPPKNGFHIVDIPKKVCH